MRDVVREDDDDVRDADAEVVEGKGLYRRMERSEEPVRMYVPGEEEYVTAWIGPS